MGQTSENLKKIDRAQLEDLLNIDEINDYIFDALQMARERYKDRIEDYYKMKRESEKGESSLDDGWQREKSYFFEFNRVENRDKITNYEWKLVKFKLEDRKDIIQMVFSDKFILEIDQAPITQQKILKEEIKSEMTGRIFQYEFVKPSLERVVGFVKETNKVDDDYLDGANKLDIRKMNSMDKEIMYQRMHRLMEEMEDVRIDIFCYLAMVEDRKRKESRNDAD